MSDYEKMLARVAETRMQTECLQAEKQRLYDAWMDKNADLLKALDAAKEAQAEAEVNLRTAAVDRYYKEGIKSFEGVTIRITKRIIYEPEKALDWAIEHRLCLGLDRRAFEKIAKDQPIDCVTVTDEPTAAIDSDLSAWLVVK